MISSTDNILSILKIVDGIEETINYNRGILVLKGGFYFGDIYMWNCGTWYYGSSRNGYADGNGILFENLPVPFGFAINSNILIVKLKSVFSKSTISPLELVTLIEISLIVGTGISNSIGLSNSIGN